MFIQTVYKPEENLDYLRDWLYHHTEIGVKHFYMYDNGGAYDCGFSSSNKNRYGISFKYTPEEAREKQKYILKDFSVTVIPWRRKNAQGKLLYNQVKSLIHFSGIVKKGLCAFIDVDEFIIKKENFKVSSMLQRKFKSRHLYKSVYDCHEVLDIYTNGWAPKVILDMENFPQLNENTHNIHCTHLNLPPTKNYFNHYNHSEIGHKWLLDFGVKIIPKAPINSDYNKCFSWIENTGLIKKKSIINNE